MMAGMNELTREVPISRETSALLVVDVQKGFAAPGYGVHKDATPDSIPERKQYLFNRLRDTTIPSIRALLDTFRKQKGEIIHTFVECLTKDGRDQSLDYKITGFMFPKGSVEAQILDEVAPLEDEILIPKTSCSVFMSTNIEYVLRNLGVTQLVMTGILTNQCVESAVRDAADRGFLVTVVEDACAAKSQPEHDAALFNFRGYARICSHAQVVQEVEGWPEKTL